MAYRRTGIMAYGPTSRGGRAAAGLVVEAGFWQACRSRKIRLMVCADFPHDSYWKSAVVEFSDGGRFRFRLQILLIFRRSVFRNGRSRGLLSRIWFWKIGAVVRLH